MQIIKRLPSHLANQIAAGEVVQRPGSVVKELLENAIDAEASKIQLLVKDGGRTSIQIIDNGKGMGLEDAKLCFERHATSKINCIDDLFKLETKGFRGEALASIGAVSHVNLRTKLKTSDTGCEIRFEGGQLIKCEEVCIPDGTSIEVKNLFFNVPARRNFLKSEAIEFNHIEDEFLRIALAHPEVHFEFINNHHELYQLPVGVAKKRISDVLGKNGSEKIFSIENKTDIVHIHGFIGKPETARKTRGHQYFFVNKRFFRSGYFNHALTQAFEGLIPEKTHPSFFIFFDVNPSKIDVNIHPTKTEIKFEEERFVYSILHSTIRESLGKFNLSPSLDFNQETAFDIPSSLRNQPVIEPTIKVNTAYNPFHDHQKGGSSPALDREGWTKNATSSDWESFYAVNQSDKPEQAEMFVADDVVQNVLFTSGKYIFSPAKKGVLVIDGKRALELVRYNELIVNFVQRPIAQQMLLFPIAHDMNTEEIRLLEQNSKLLEQLGFKYSCTQSQVEIHAAPSILAENLILSCIESLVHRLGFQDVEKADLAHILVAELCRQSTGNVTFTDHAEAQNLIERLMSLPSHSLTPFNQPILGAISFDQIDKLIQ